MDQHLLARLQARQVMQRVVHGEEGTRNGRRCFERHPFGDACNGVGVGDQAVGEAAGAKAHHTVTRGEVAHCLGAFALHHTGKFEAQGRAGEAVFDGFIRQQAEGEHHVTEVKARRTHLNVQLIRRRLTRLTHFPAQVAQLARQVEAQAHPLRIAHCAARLIGQHAQARHVATAFGVQGQLGFAVGVQQRRYRQLDRCRMGQIEQANTTVRGFVGQGTAKAPQGGVADGRNLSGGVDAVQVLGSATAEQPALRGDRQRLTGLHQRGRLHAALGLAIEACAAVETGQVQHMLRGWAKAPS